MSGRYSTLEVQGGDIGGFPTWRSSVSSLTSETLHPKNNRYNVKRTKGRTRLMSLPVALHIAVFVLYVSLCVVWITGIASNIRVELASAARIQTWLNLICHFIMLALSTAIVAVMQHIATRSSFGNLPQPLTSLSDKILSWRGLGSSLLNLYHNLGFPTTLGHAILTATYFSALSGLGISSSFIFNVPAINETVISNVTTRIGSPSLGQLFQSQGSNLSDFTDLAFDWYRSSMGIGMLASDNTAVYPGLSANRVYDTLLLPIPAPSNTSAVVSYTDFNVKCGSVPQVSVSASWYGEHEDDVGTYGISPGTNSSSPSDGSAPRGVSLLSIRYMLNGSSMTLYDALSVWDPTSINAIGDLWQPADILFRVPNSDVAPGIGRNLILYNIYDERGWFSKSQPILDSEDSAGSPWTFQFDNAPPPSDYSDWEAYTHLRVQVIGCSLSTSSGLATIDATTNRLLDAPSSLQGAQARSIWSEWKPDVKKSNRLEDTWAAMFLPNVGSVGLWDSQPVPPVQSSPDWSCFSYLFGKDIVTMNTKAKNWTVTALDNMYQRCHVPTIIEDYLTTRVFGPVTTDADGYSERNASLVNATLGTLESTLASATAMTMWSAAKGSVLTVTTNTTSKTSLPVRLAPVNGFTSVSEQVLAGRITFNALSLIAGTVLSAVLSALGICILVRGGAARPGDTPINDAELLSLMLLDNSAIASRLSYAVTHDVQARRRAGGFMVGLLDGRLVLVENLDHV